MIWQSHLSFNWESWELPKSDFFPVVWKGLIVSCIYRLLLISIIIFVTKVKFFSYLHLNDHETFEALIDQQFCKYNFSFTESPVGLFKVLAFTN